MIKLGHFNFSSKITCIYQHISLSFPCVHTNI